MINMKTCNLLTLFVSTCVGLFSVGVKGQSDPRTNAYWYKEGQLEIQKRLKLSREVFGQSSETGAKNVIFFLGDGMGMSTITATRILLSQQNQLDINNPSLIFDKFPFVSLAKVNTLDSPVGDSASTATAFLGGVKGNLKTIGVNGKVAYKDCKASLVPENRVKSAFAWAQDNDMLTGLVTTMRVTHASPAGLYAHTASRKWEATGPKPCLDIARQLVQGEVGSKIRVILGGGQSTFLPECKGKKDNCGSRRTDNLNLMQEWIDDKKKQGVSASLLTTKSELDHLNAKEMDYLFGTFATSHLEFRALKTNHSEEPSLKEMSLKALDVLEKDGQRYFLFIEGGLIDHGHHRNQAQLALSETIDFVQAIESVIQRVNLSETLILVTADHSHSLTINGYPEKESNILIDHLDQFKGSVFTALMYGNGPGYKTNSTLDINNPEYEYKAAAFAPSSTHSGEDVPVYAIGPGSSLFTGVYDQTYIAHAVRYVLSLGAKLRVKESDEDKT